MTVGERIGLSCEVIVRRVRQLDLDIHLGGYLSEGSMAEVDLAAAELTLRQLADVIKLQRERLLANAPKDMRAA